MAQSLSLKVKGLITNPNTFENNYVDGALAIADNIVIDKDNVGESRRGFNKYGQYISFGENLYEETFQQLINFQNRIIVHHTDKLLLDPQSNDTWVPYTGSFSAPGEGYRVRAVESNQNLYITTSNGIYKLASATGQFEKAGQVRALDGDGVVDSSSGGWMSTNTAVAYRLIWVKKDSNGNLIVGSPSSRLVLGNSSGSPAVVDLTWNIPEGITVNDTYQIYRSGPTENFTDEPNDELQLVLEGNPTQADIDNKYFERTDEIPTDLRGVTLYTSPSQQGIAQSNEVPPFAKDMTVFKNHVFYANCRTKHRFSFKLVGVGTNGFDVGDTISINGLTYTGHTSNDFATRKFKVQSTASPALDIEATAINLVKCINSDSDNDDIYAYYTSQFSEVPGQILLEKVELDETAFTVTSNAEATSFTPELPVSGATEKNTSTNEVKVNRIYISKPQQPEAVPLSNFLEVGSQNQPIRRILSSRDYIYIFKDDGVFKISGTSLANFQVTTVDSTLKLLAPESAVIFNNSVFAMTNQGVASVSDAGTGIVSKNIERDLLRLKDFSAFSNATFAVSYESERKYILFTVASENDLWPTQAYVYNSLANAWTRWEFNASCGVINAGDDKLYLGGKVDGYAAAWIHKERKTFTSDDYVDDDWGVQIMNVHSPTYLTLNRVQDCVVGYWLRQYLAEDEIYVVGKIADIDEENNRVTLTNVSGTWSNNPAFSTTIYKPITTRLKWVANHAGNPGIQKHFRETTMFFRQATEAVLNIGYETSFQPGYEFTQKATINAGLWGTFGWGTIPWGGLDATFAQPLRVGIPRNKQRALWISLSVEGSNAFSSFALSGVSVVFEGDSERYSYKPGVK